MYLSSKRGISSRAGCKKNKFKKRTIAYIFVPVESITNRHG
jgi:hypothetical protein